eukprot:TRINITY_DN2552_c0_g1_i2.p1 TRINITY_DN2552_c0_g1~~TRINITY_DN2552_c0_g1_i2.p1  ORF type:complete len:124 (+),score=23.55 TRINITY_DN2552_c0_g1_i2:205-576(+)
MESMSNNNQIQYNINNNNININNNINNHHITPFPFNSITPTNTNNLLFAFIGSDDGKYAQRNAILCIDVQKGFSQMLFDPLSIALINNTQVTSNIHHTPRSHIIEQTQSYSSQQTPHLKTFLF